MRREFSGGRGKLNKQLCVEEEDQVEGGRTAITLLCTLSLPFLL